MNNISCSFQPGGRSCGAFSVGMCSDCGMAICRYHGSYFDDRLLCDSCKEVIQALRAREAQAAADAELIRKQEADRIAKQLADVERERVLAEKRREVAQWAALPVMTNDDWLIFLMADDMFGQIGERPVYRGKRPGDLSIRDVAELCRDAGFQSQRIAYSFRFIFGRTVFSYAKGWIVGKDKVEHYVRGDLMNEHVLVLVLERGEVACVSKERRGSRLVRWASVNPSWKPNVNGMTSARALLRNYRR